MIIYSVTVAIDRDVEDAWLAWMRDTHIPDVLATGFFRAAEIRRQIDATSDAKRATYVIEYACDSLERYEFYRATKASALQQDHGKRYAGKFEASRQLFERIG